MLVEASAPGSLMLLGEHAVLHGKHALVCAVNQRMIVSLQSREDKQIKITSPALGHYTTDLAKLKMTRPFQFVTATLYRYRKHMKLGCNLTIHSEFSDKMGFASSAAVTVATLKALTTWLKIKLSPLELIREARAIVCSVQGLGSGADVAACVLGGIVAYKMQPLLAEKISYHFPLTAIYSGYKTPTVEVVQQVQKRFSAHPKIYKQLCQSIDACVQQGILAARKKDWQKMGQVMNIQQGLMEALGVSTPLLNDIVTKLRQQSKMLGAKISGSGLGDCVIGLGKTSSLSFDDKQIRTIPIEISVEGVMCEKS